MAVSGCQAHQGWPKLENGDEYRAKLKDGQTRPVVAWGRDGKHWLWDRETRTLVEASTVVQLERPFRGGWMAVLSVVGIALGALVGGLIGGARPLPPSSGGLGSLGRALDTLSYVGVGAAVGLVSGLVVGAILGAPRSYDVAPGLLPNGDPGREE
jgi:hypothetical protein